MILSSAVCPVAGLGGGMFRSPMGPRIALFTALLASAAFAQRDLATLAGTITDPQGGVVPNAKITITEADTGQVYSTLTNTLGEFVRPALKPSTYNVSVQAPGFKTAEQKDVVLTA